MKPNKAAYNINNNPPFYFSAYLAQNIIMQYPVTPCHLDLETRTKKSNIKVSSNMSGKKKAMLLRKENSNPKRVKNHDKYIEDLKKVNASNA